MRLAGVPVVKETALPEAMFDSINSPTLPAAALSFVVVPITPEVDEKEILVALAAPSVGVTNVGDVPKTNAPLPVSFVTAAARLALDGVAKKVATPAASPLTPEPIGNPVQLVNVPDVGVPKIGVTNVGEVANTSDPLPVSSVIALAKLALDGVVRNVATPVPRPLTPLLIGRPVQFVNVPDVGVPNKGVTKVGDVPKTNAPFPVSSVTADARLALEGTAKNVATPVPKPLIPVLTGNPVQFVMVPDVGVPNKGVTSVGDVPNTSAPEPVSSVTAAARLTLDGVAKNVAIFAAKPLIPVETGSPVQLVNVPALGIPMFGVTKVGEPEPTNEPVPVCPDKDVFTALLVAI